MSTKSISNIPCAYATASAGMHPSHSLVKKLEAIAGAGFKLVEIAFPDLETHAETLFQGAYQNLDPSGKGDVEKLEEAARDVAGRCGRLGLKVLTVMPFSEFEGYSDVSKRQRSLDRAKAWLRIVKAIGGDMLQVGSTDDAATTSDRDVLSENLRELADLAALQSLRIGYEPWAWAVHAETWQRTWDLISRVDRPNFGLCLDTFQLAARAYADPTSDTGMLPDAEEQLRASLDELTRTFSHPAAQAKLFYFQISDGARIPPAEVKKAAAEEENATTGKPGIDPLYAWSNKARPLPLEGLRDVPGEPEKGEYLPVLQIIEAVLKTGWRGPWSYEVFFEKDQNRDDPTVPTKWTKDAAKCHAKLLELLRERGFD